MRELIYEIVLEQHKIHAREDFAVEGFITGVVADIGHNVHGIGSRVIGWFEGVSKKQLHVNEMATGTIEWLKEEEKEHKHLELDMGGFKTWLKTSEIINYRYYYLLNDSIYNELVNDLKHDKISELEDFLGHIVNDLNSESLLLSIDMKDRKSATRMLDSIRTIKDLIVLVEKYKARVNVIFDLLSKRDRSIKGFPLQLMLSGMADLRQTVKKIVNLAI